MTINWPFVSVKTISYAAKLEKRIQELERELTLVRGSVQSASQSTAELISRLQWTDNQLIEMEKSVQFGD